MTTQSNKHPEGIGGWLILVVIGLVLSPVAIAITLLRDHAPIFMDGTWEALTTPGNEFYHPLWVPLIAFEVIGNLALIALALATLVLIFKRARAAPVAAISWFVAGLLVMWLDLLLGYQIPLIAEQPLDDTTRRELIRSFVAAAIWIPYFLVSKRVKATFTRDWPWPARRIIGQ